MVPSYPFPVPKIAELKPPGMSYANCLGLFFIYALIHQSAAVLLLLKLLPTGPFLANSLTFQY